MTYIASSDNFPQIRQNLSSTGVWTTVEKKRGVSSLLLSVHWLCSFFTFCPCYHAHEAGAEAAMGTLQEKWTQTTECHDHVCFYIHETFVPCQTTGCHHVCGNLLLCAVCAWLRFPRHFSTIDAKKVETHVFYIPSGLQNGKYIPSD